MTLLVVKNLEKSFAGVDAVADVSFALAAGEILAMIGPNGAGKSTCFNMLNGQLRPDRGKIFLAGADITGLQPRAVWRLGVGRSFQVAATFASMTVRENVQMALISHARDVWRFFRAATALHRERAEELLGRLGMADQAERPAAKLAYGDLKRLELAMAMASEPSLLLMDEPTAGMAPAERAQLMALVRRLATERNLAVLFTEHDMDVVFATADRVLVLDRGKLIAEGPPAAIRVDKKVRAVYLGEDC
jgi:branched-chain amino acid transport system ATP-binding protein